MKTANPNSGRHAALQTRRGPARRRRLDETVYRHVIDGLERPPGAYAHYRYRDAWFPTTYFRRADDRLCQAPATATRRYLDLLHLAAHHSQDQVAAPRQPWLASGPPLRAAQVETRLPGGPAPTPRAGAGRRRVTPVDRRRYEPPRSARPVDAKAAV